MKKEKFRLTIKELFYLSAVVLLFVSMIKSWDSLSSRIKIIKEAKLNLALGLKEQEDLKRELARSESREYIEETAREKLNMSKEGELVILLPTPILIPSPTPILPDRSSNWQKWVKLFL